MQLNLILTEITKKKVNISIFALMIMGVLVVINQLQILKHSL